MNTTDSPPASLVSDRLRWFNAPLDRVAIKQHVIAITLQIQANIRNSSGALSIYPNFRNIVNLCHGLSSLELHRQAISIALLAVNICRDFAKVDPIVYLPYLALALQFLSKLYVFAGVNGNKEITTREEAISIIGHLYSSSRGKERPSSLHIALATLACIFTCEDDLEDSLEAANNCLHIYEETIIQKRIQVTNWSTIFPHSRMWFRNSYGRSTTTLSDIVHIISYSVWLLSMTDVFARLSNSGVQEVPGLFFHRSGGGRMNGRSGHHHVACFLRRRLQNTITPNHMSNTPSTSWRTIWSSWCPPTTLIRTTRPRSNMTGAPGGLRKLNVINN